MYVTLYCHLLLFDIFTLLKVVDVKENSTMSPSKFRKAKGQPLTSDLFNDEEGKLFLEECERSPGKSIDFFSLV